MKRNCGHCDYYDKEKSECHRKPPLYIDKDRSFPFVFNAEKCWCGDWIEESMVGGPENYVNVSIRDHKTAAEYSGPRLFPAPKPGQVTIWDFRTNVILSDDFEIRVDWPLAKKKSKDENTKH